MTFKLSPIGRQNGRQIGDKLDRIGDKVAGFGDCRLCRQCVPGFSFILLLHVLVCARTRITSGPRFVSVFFHCCRLRLFANAKYKISTEFKVAVAFSPGNSPGAAAPGNVFVASSM